MPLLGRLRSAGPLQSLIPWQQRCMQASIQQARFVSAYNYAQVKALVFSQHGEPSEVLNLHQHSISPSPPPGMMLLRTLAATINPADINTIQGTYGTSLPFTTELGTSSPSAVPGNEGLFEVLALGDGVAADDFKQGDWVIPSASQLGTWRTHALLPAESLLRIGRSGLKPVDAAAVSVNPCTAYRILRAYGPADPRQFDGRMLPLAPGSGDWFIQNGANSGVGRAAIQFAHQWGLRSINIIRERSTPEGTTEIVDELKSLGADHVITEGEMLSSSKAFKERIASITRDGRQKIGLGLNCVGGQSATALTKTLGEGGTLVTYGSMSRKPAPLPTGLQIFKDVRLLGFWLSRWGERDRVGKKHAVMDILNMAREGRFVQAPVQEVGWKWDTTADTLRSAVAGTLGGFKHKGMFVFENDDK